MGLPAITPTTITKVAKNTPALIVKRPKDLVAFLRNYFASLQKTTTFLAYSKDLMDFAVFLGVAKQPVGIATNGVPLLPKFTPELAAQASALLLEGPKDGLSWGGGEANQLVLEYRNELQKRKAAPATINRRLSMLRSLVKAARMFGIVTFHIEIPDLDNETYRDTSGPGKENVMKMLAFLANKIKTTKGISQKQAIRDYAITRLLFDLALRRAEVCSLDLKDYVKDTKGNLKLMVLGKGRMKREALSLPQNTSKALDIWIAVRGTHEGPMFFPFSGKGTGVLRLSETSVYRIIEGLGRKVGIRARPHGLRHAAITEALDRTNGDIRKVMKYSRHRNPATVMIYDDNRKDLGGEVANLVSGD